jgi:hypothetical protein
VFKYLIVLKFEHLAGKTPESWSRGQVESTPSATEETGATCGS